jgi:hypothetical protein
MSEMPNTGFGRSSFFRGERFRTWLFSIIATLIPFLVADVLPIADLAQHVAQVRIGIEYLSGETTSLYDFQWWTPYTLNYLAFLLFWPVGDAFLTGKLGFLLLTLVNVSSIHLFASWRGISPRGALIASMFVFGISFYWGFTAFFVGLATFLLWMKVSLGLLETGEVTWRRFLFGCLASVLLYSSHILWLGFALSWTVAEGMRQKSARKTLWLLAMMSPVLVATVVWYPTLGQAGFVSPPEWLLFPSVRLNLNWVVTNGLSPLSDGLLVLPVTGFLVLIVTTLRQIYFDLDPSLALAALLAAALFILAPSSYQSTIGFSERWATPALVFFCLSAFRNVEGFHTWQPPTAKGVVLVFSLITSWNWHQLDKMEFSGLQEAVEAIEKQHPRVVGLSYRRDSDYLAASIRPFLQSFAWAQAEHGGRVNFSFAQFAPMPFVFRDSNVNPWTPNLEWYPERLRREDLAHFDYAIVNGEEAHHKSLTNSGLFSPITSNGHWRLYSLSESNIGQDQ